MASVLGKQRVWTVERDNEGHRTYNIRHLVEATVDEGPNSVLNASGLPVVGSVWNFDGDMDAWAFCWPEAKVTHIIQNEKNIHWHVDQTFSTKPRFRCSDTEIEDPLLEPQQISGTFVKYTKEAIYDRNGDLIKSSSHELYKGPQVEFDANRPQVVISQNVPLLGIATFSPMVDTVNGSALWGLPARSVKLSNVAWERKLYARCFFYYTRTFTFDVMYETFDRDILDEGTKVLNGDWDRDATSPTYGKWVTQNVGGAAPDPDDPQHFVRYKDRKGENARVILNGEGLPADAALGTGGGNAGPPGTISVEYYGESNFLLLNIPTIIGP